MHRVPAACALLALAGCADGKVKADGFSFGKVRSADWMERKLISEAGDEQRHDFVLFSVGSWCRKSSQAYPVLGRSWTSVQEVIAADPSDAVAICEAKRDFYDTAANELSFLDGGFSVATVQLRHPNEPLAEPPAVGSYDEAGFDAALPYVAVTVDLFDLNPYRHFADMADCEGNPNFWESDAEDALIERHAQYTLAEGSATADKPNPDTYKIAVEGTVEDRGGKAAGDLVLKGSFAHCDLTWDGDFPELW